MENRQEIIKKKRRQKSIFCEKKPASCLVWLAIHLQNEKLWIACKGKLYQNGWVRYTHQGKEVKVSPRYCNYWPGFTEEKVLEQVKMLNLQYLEYNHPTKARRKPWYEVAEAWGEPIFAEETNTTAPAIVVAEEPAQLPATEAPRGLVRENTDVVVDIIPNDDILWT